MRTFFLSVGINRYKDRAYPELSCCENDANELQALFKRSLKLGDRARKLVGAVDVTSVYDEIHRIGGEIRNGDTFVFFFAGHGYEDPDHKDQFMLFPNALAKLVIERTSEGMLRLSALRTLTDDWAGVTRIFILDACRHRLPKGHRGANPQVFGNQDGLAYVVSRSPGFGPLLDGSENSPSNDHLQPIVLNAARNGQGAREIQDLGRGALSLALERSLEAGIQSGKPVWLDETMLADIEQQMRGILLQASFSEVQTPVLFPPHAKALLFRPERPENFYQIKTLRERFEEQFSRAAFDTPWGECCNQTLVQLSALGLPVAEQQTLQSRLQIAIEQRREAKQESEWEILLSDFERQLQMGKLETPTTDNCRETLMMLRTSSFPANRLTPLGQRLQDAIDQRQAIADREHDDRLIALARQHGATSLGKSYAQNYLGTARNHEHDDEALAIIADAESASHGNSVQQRDIERRRQAENGGSLSAWEKCAREAESPELRKFAETTVFDLRKRELDAARTRDEAQDADLLRNAQASPSMASWQNCLFQARTETLRKKAQEEIQRLEKSSETKRQESEKRDQSRLQRAIETNTFAAWEECWLNSETSAVKETAKSRMAALKAREAADKSRDTRLLAAAEKADTTEAWEDVLSKATEDDLRKRAKREIARIKQKEINGSRKLEQEQRDHARFQKALKTNTLEAWKECLQNAETDTLKESASTKIATIEAQRSAEDAHDAKLIAKAENLKTADAWEFVLKNAKRSEVRDRARQELSRIGAESQAARQRDEKRASAEPDKETTLAHWRKLLAEMETGWGKNLANEAIETLVANDHAAWKSVTSENTAPAYQHYLDSQPEGKWRFEARSRMASIEAKTAGGGDKDETPPEKPTGIGNYAIAGLAILVLGAFFVYSKTTNQQQGNSSGNSTILSAPSPAPAPSAAPVLKENSERASQNIAAWEEKAKTIQAGPWWKSSQDQKAGKMSDDEKSWVTQTIQYATANEPAPLAQLMLASLQCRGIAAPLVELDPQACGKTLAATLANPGLPAGKPGDKVDDGIGLLFDKWVPVSGPEVNRAFAQAIAPGLAARKEQYPNLALRLALVQACYLQPTDRSAAIKTLNGVKAAAQGKPAETAARMLDDLNAAKALPSWCRS